MDYIIENDTTRKIIQTSLEFHIRLEIAGADLIIEDLDIDVEFWKSKTENPNKSVVKIWNLSDDTFKRLQQTTAMDVYTWYGDDEPSLTFRGYINPETLVKMNAVAGKINTAKGFLASTVKQDNRGQFDIPTIIELVDGHANYTASKMDKTYLQSVTSKTLINDCIEAMGIGVAYVSDKLKEKTYSNGYKLKGKPHIILSTLLKPLGASYNICNGLIYVTTPEDEAQSQYAILLSPENSMQPDQQNTENIIVSTRFIPFVNPNDWVKFDFKEFNGLEQITDVYSKINNYGTTGSTELVINIPKPKKTKKKKKDDKK